MPFFQTALLPGANESSGENINSFTAVRFRLQGSGDLQLTLFSLDETQNEVLVPLGMSSGTNIQPTRLANFIQQRAMLKGYTNERAEWARINRVIVFQRELFSSYPG